MSCGARQPAPALVPPVATGVPGTAGVTPGVPVTPAVTPAVTLPADQPPPPPPLQLRPQHQPVPDAKVSLYASISDNFILSRSYFYFISYLFGQPTAEPYKIQYLHSNPLRLKSPWLKRSGLLPEARVRILARGCINKLNLRTYLSRFDVEGKYHEDTRRPRIHQPVTAHY